MTEWKAGEEAIIDTAGERVTLRRQLARSLFDNGMVWEVVLSKRVEPSDVVPFPVHESHLQKVPNE